MKKLVCILLAAAVAAAAFTGCRGRKTGDDVTDIGAKPTPVTTPVTPISPGATRDPRAYDNSTTVDKDGIQTGAFNWNYFKAKVSAGYNGEVKLVWTENGEKIEKMLTMKAKKLSLEGDDREFAFLNSSVVGRSGGNPVNVYFLTNDEGMTLAQLIGISEADLASGLPDGAGMGFSNDRGVIVMIEKPATDN